MTLTKNCKIGKKGNLLNMVLVNIAVNDATVFDMDGSYEAGQFGLYSYSKQGTIIFSDFTAKSNPVLEPQTILLFGIGLMGHAV